MDKFLKIGFSVFALGAIIFGFVRLADNLHLKFNEEEGSSATASEQLLEETKQRITDTDTDSLSDWDELNTYGTSPYLADSDSDGLSDAEELKSQTDPNCPKGKECGSSDLSASPAVGSGQEEADETKDESVGAIDKELLGELNNLTPDEIRAILKQGGVSDEQLQGASDEDLRKLLEEVISNENR